MLVPGRVFVACDPVVGMGRHPHACPDSWTLAENAGTTLFFAATVQSLARELQGAPGIDLSLFYLDDGVVAGDVAAVAAALRHVQERGAALGLSLNLAKCELITVGELPEAALLL